MRDLPYARPFLASRSAWAVTLIVSFLSGHDDFPSLSLRNEVQGEDDNGVIGGYAAPHYETCCSAHKWSMNGQIHR